MIQALLTIDDIPSDNTCAIVDYLNKAGIQAIMFAVGEKAEKNLCREESVKLTAVKPC